MKPPELSNDIFNVLLNMLNSVGIEYASPKGKGKETRHSTSTEGPMGRNLDFDMGLVLTLEATARDALEHPISNEGCSQTNPVLLVSMRHPAKCYGHAVFRVKKMQKIWGYMPMTALYFYQLLHSSQDLQLEHVNGLVDNMSPHLIRLATAQSPVFRRSKACLMTYIGTRPVIVHGHSKWRPKSYCVLIRHIPR